MIAAKQLNGLSLEKAECFGKPHILASYTAPDNVRKYRHEEGLCPVCHSRLITNTHHQPDRVSFTMRTKWGIFVLKPALFGLCGSGTTGCHGLIEANKLNVEWVWDKPRYLEDWWSGYTLAHMLKLGITPHSPKLYEQGCWVFSGERNFIYRGGLQ